jgi:predicted membrane protein (TIGR00267 family)
MDDNSNNSNDEDKKRKSFFSFIRRWREYSEITNAGPIYRRFFVKNGFDGALTILGIIIGAWIANGGLWQVPASLVFSPEQIQFIVLSGLGASLSMGVSGLWGSFLTESAERKKELMELERSMVMKRGSFKNTYITRAQRFSATFAAIIDGVSPALFAVICLLPFFLGFFLPINDYVFISSLIVTYIVLFFLGVFLGNISKKNVIIYGLKMATAGIVVALIFLFIPSG